MNDHLKSVELRTMINAEGVLELSLEEVSIDRRRAGAGGRRAHDPRAGSRRTMPLAPPADPSSPVLPAAAQQRITPLTSPQAQVFQQSRPVLTLRLCQAFDHTWPPCQPRAFRKTERCRSS